MHIEYEHQNVASSSFDHYSVVVVDCHCHCLAWLHVANGARQGPWWMASGKWTMAWLALALAIAFLALALALAFVLANAFCRRLSLCLGNGARRRWSLHGWSLHG